MNTLTTSGRKGTTHGNFMRHRHLPFLITQLVTGLVFPVTINAATVTTCNEAGLRAAIAQGGTVNFVCDGTITLTNTIEVTNSITLDGTGRQVVISGGGQVRLFQVNTGVVFSARHLAFSDGRHQGTNPGGDGQGAGFLILGGFLNLVDCSLSNHFVEGGSSDRLVAAAGQARGGAICAFGGQVNLTNCVLYNNQSKGGLAYPSIAVLYLPAGSALGGAVYAQGGSVTTDQTDFRSNRTIGGDVQSVPLGPAGGPPGEAQGGALYATSTVVVVKSSSVRSNYAIGGGIGSGTGGAARGGALSLVDGTYGVSGSVFLANSVLGGGGGRLGRGGEGSGGAIHNFGNLHIMDSRFAENSATGASAPFPGKGLGGAISSPGRVTLERCTLNDNQAKGGDGVAGGPFGGPVPGTNGRGGAIYSESLFAGTNLTIVGNRATGGTDAYFAGHPVSRRAGLGGGVYFAGGTAALVHVTVALNSADVTPLFGSGITNSSPPQGGGIAALAGNVMLFNSILSSNLAGSNCFGAVIDGGHNISSDGSCHFTAAGSLNNTDPLLSPLADYGGPTPTMALLPGSPAIDAASSESCPGTDQRGVARPFGGGCDIGAFEFSTPSILGRLFMERIGVGAVRGTFAGEANQTFRVEVSENLASWSPYSTNTTASSGLFEFFDTNSAIAEARTFRVSKP